ncbi:hypothetical protein Tco_0752019 [Tanacetum coccineum]|uniref:Uncharacterized protein n=1 Tax=Tanacetum coccineum TaxID=301880 RepID=A0ABQ4Z9C2_9ASTR
MPGEYAARRRDSNFEMVSSIDVRSYNHGSDASDLFRQTMCSARFMRVHAVCIDHDRSSKGLRSGYYWPTAPGRIENIYIVAIAYFTKWASNAKAELQSQESGDFVYRAKSYAAREDTGKLGQSGKDPTRIRKHLGKKRSIPSCVT